MYDIEMHRPSEEFGRCWSAAGRHIQRQVQGPFHSWLKVSLDPPFLEHLSFRLGNQLFFLRIEDAARSLDVPGNREGLRLIANGCKGHACLMPMRRDSTSWEPVAPGWGLVDLRTGKPVDPISLVNDAQIEMTHWELQDFAVQIVRDHLKKQGKKLMSWQGNPAVDPSIWFVGDLGPEWVVVRAARYPSKIAERPANWHAIAERCSHLSKIGHFASVAVANSDNAQHPLWRGHGMTVAFEGMAPA